jgi:hypothetical protein
MIYKAFEQSDVVSGRSVKISTGFFTNGSLFSSQSLFVTSSTQEIISGSNRYDVYNGYYYLDVFPNSTESTSADQIFSISYGNKNGYGTSYDEYTNIKVHPTQAIWTQYVNELNGGESFSVKTQNGSTGVVSTVSLSQDFVALSFNSQKVKDTIDPGQFQISLKHSSSGITWRLIDDSSVTGQSGSSGAYNLILGEYDTNGTATYWTSSADVLNIGGTTGGIGTPSTEHYGSPTFQYYPSTGIGLFYPKSGVIVINPEFLSTIDSVKIPSLAGASNYRNTMNSTMTNCSIKKDVYQMISASALYGGEQFRIRRSEYVPSRHYFIRVKNREFNYTNNPTFSYQTAQTDSSGNFHQRGDIIQTEFLTDPKVYPTSVGLYNNNNELVAVGKLSSPYQKTFTNELLIKVRLDF